MKILVIDNNIDRDSWGAASIVRFAREVSGATVTVRRAPEQDLPADPLAFDRVVVSGSKTTATDDAPWIEKLSVFMRNLLDAGRPLLGVCYGHQMLARTLGGKQVVHQAAAPEFGWSRIETIAPSVLMAGLPEVFYSYSSHFDEVIELPPGTKLLARSEACSIQAFQAEGRPVFGIQFHPERNLAEAKQSLAQRKKLGVPKVLLHPDKSDKLFDPKVGETIFRNFFTL